MTSKNFTKFYQKLNPAQKEAVDSIEGPVMVVAGPGTGKTQILTLRIANILRKTDVEPDNILALTFTESGTYSMRKRLVEIIGSSAYRVSISTFHGFCNDVIRTYPEEFPRIIGSTNITEIDQIRILKKIISSLSLKKLRPYGDEFYYLRPILSAISELKREDIDEKKFEDLAKKQEKEFLSMNDLYHRKGAYRGKMKSEYSKLEKDIEKNKELAVIYKKYQNELQKNKFYDYDDMILEVIKSFKTNNDLLLSFQEKYHYILADEHQDANSAQNTVLELLCNYYKNPNLFIVGDEKQAIFRFQGASLENFLYFKNQYPKAKIINLEHNYRSTQSILDAADSLISKNLAKIFGFKTGLKSNSKEKKEKIALYEFSTSDVENYFLARDIEKKIKAGVSPTRIVVLYRDNKDVLPPASFFEKVKIPFVIESDQDILQDQDIQKLILILKTIYNFGSDELFFKALHIDFLDIEPLDIYKIIDFSRRNKSSGFNVVSSEKIMEERGLESKEQIAKFYKNISLWKKDSHNKNFIEFFEIVVRDSGFLSYLLSKDEAVEKMDKLNGLFDFVKESVESHKNYSLQDFIDYLEMLEEHNVLVKKSLGAKKPNSVRLMTAHRAKGLEFDYVYIINAFDGHWGNKRSIKHFNLPRPTERYGCKSTGRGLPLAGLGIKASIEKNNDDERRLFYVAMTRAKKGISISYARESAGRRQQIPSLFISEIDSKFIENKDTGLYEEGFTARKQILFSPKLGQGPSIKNKEFLKELFVNRGLSVTALNNYLDCPWKYFYNNLLRIPKAQSKYLMYGTAVHSALRDFFNKFRVGDDPRKEFLLKLFGNYLNKEPIEKRDFTELLEKGKGALSGYYDFYYSNWERNILNEFNVAGVQLTPQIRLTGKLDKIEILNSSGEVNVVDYKTGKPKSRREIEGLTRTSKGDYKRQLVFYNLLLDKYGSKKYKMVSGTIDFVEPNERGVYKKESFIIEKEEILELEKLIKSVADEIMNLKFWGRGCDDKNCEDCRLRNLML